MTVRVANYSDITAISAYDEWIAGEALIEKIGDNQVYVAYSGDEEFIGWLRFGFFGDNTPFLNMLHLLEEYRGKGYGTRMVAFWENEMREAGYEAVLTSSAQTETAQHFYTKLGYKAIGSFTLAAEPLEIIFAKFI